MNYNEQQDYNMLMIITMMIIFFLLCIILLAFHIDYNTSRIIQLLP